MIIHNKTPFALLSPEPVRCEMTVRGHRRKENHHNNVLTNTNERAMGFNGENNLARINFTLKDLLNEMIGV